MSRRLVGRGARSGMFFLAALAALAVLGARPALAQGDPRTPTRVTVVTLGPGDHPFFKFGHNALMLDYASGESVVFNWGTFIFDSPMLIPTFLRGRMKYWLSLSPGKETLQHYIDENRTVEVQELDLTEAQRLELAERLYTNARRENREYLYDYFWDNCSTRVRDAVDATVGGLVRQAAAVPAAQTQRAHALRSTADLFYEYLGLNFGLGSLTDASATMWEEAFLPERFRDLLDKVAVPSEAGGRKPLVKSHVVVFRAARPDKPSRPPTWWPWFALVGVLSGGAMAGLGLAARGNRAARVALGLGTSLLGLVFGLLGLILVLLWVLTNHRVAYANENILQAAPWALVLVGYGVGVALGRPRATWRASLVVASVGAASVLGVLLKALPWFHQDNGAFIVLLLPLWAGLAFGLHRLARAAAAATAAAAPASTGALRSGRARAR
jgi:hypothetical protein